MTDVYGETEGFSETEAPRPPVDQGRLGGVFCQLYRRKFSGLVEIASEGRSAMVTFRKGRPVSLDDASAGTPLGEQLVDAGTLTRAQYSAVIARVTEGWVENEDLAFCQHAVELGFLDWQQAGVELSQRVRMRMIQLLAWQGCEVMLEELDEVACGPGEYPQELGAIVYMGVRTFYDDAMLRGYLPEPSSHYLQLRSQPALIAEFFALEHDELKLLRAVDPKSTVDTLIDASILDPAHAIALLALLQIGQLCQFSRSPFVIEAERERSGARPFPAIPPGRTQDPRRASQNAMRAIGAGRPLSQQGMPVVNPGRAPSQQGVPAANPRRAPSQHGMPAVNPGRAPSQHGMPAVNPARSPSQRNFPALDPAGPSTGSSIPPALRASRSVSESPPPTEEVNHSASQYKMTAVQPGRPPTNPRLGAVQASRPLSQQGLPAASPEPAPTVQPQQNPAGRPPSQQRMPPIAAPTQPLMMDATQEALREAAARAAQTKRNPPPRMNRAPFQEPARPAPTSPREMRASTDVSRPLPAEPAQDRNRAPEPQRTAAEAPLDPAARAEYAKAHLNEIMRRRQAKPQANEANAAPPRRDPMRELRQAQELLRDQHYARAEEVLRSLAESDPSNELFRAYLLWARFRNVAELESGQTSELTDLAKKLIQIPEHLAFACYVLGHIYLGAKKDELAEKYFRRAHAADRANKDAERHLLILERRKQQAAEADATANRKIFGITIANKPKT